MNIDDLLKLINLLTQLESVVVSQYQKYQTEKGLTDEQMKQHLKDMNAEDAAAFDHIIELANG